MLIEDFYQYNNEQFMYTSNFFSLNWTEVKSALIYAILTALVAMGTYVVNVGSIFKIDSGTLIDIGIMSLIIGGISILKNLLTTSSGHFLGMVKVK